MNKYILDTDIVSYLWDEKSVHHQKVVEQLNRLDDEDIVGISVVSIYELTYGMDSFKQEYNSNQQIIRKSISSQLA